MKAPEPIEIEAAEVERLIEQAQQGQLDAAAQQRMVPLLHTLLWLERTLLETRISLNPQLSLPDPHDQHRTPRA
jgi:hypothetical protein